MQDNATGQLIIVGAGGFGREVYAWAQASMRAGDASWLTVKGFLDDNPAALKDFNLPVPIISSVREYTPQAGDQFICAIGSPAQKQQICLHLEKIGAQFTSIIHPTAHIEPDAKIAYGAIIGPKSGISINTTVGKLCTLNFNSVLGHDVTVGDYATISGFCDITGAVKLGNCVFIGSHASVLPKTQVGDNATIGAGSVVIRNVRENTTVFGSPARKI